MADDVSTVGHYVTLQRGKTYKGNLVGHPGPALLGLGSITPGGGFRESDYKTYGGDCPSQLTLYPGDLFVSLKGATKDGKMIGSVARVPGSVAKGRLTQDTCKLEFKHPSREVSDFIYWILRTPHYRDYCEGRATGSAVVALSRDDFLSYPVPPLTPARHRLVGLFEAIEAKLRTNMVLGATLEAMSRAIFKSWFVDFDPVREKAVGKQPVGMDAETAALFPDSFEDSEIGEVPIGWDVVPLPEIVEVNPARSLRKGEVADYLDMANMPTHGHTPDELIARPFGSGTRFMNGDTLVARITPCLENGKTAFVDCLRANEVAWGSTEFIVLRPYPPLPPEFAYCLARDEGFREFAIQSMTGSSGRQRVPAESLDHFRLARPPAGLAEAFAASIQPYFRRIRAAANESRTLAALRDTLLPKLLSGEVRVTEAEEIIEESVR